MIVINFVEIPKGMNYPHRAAEYRKGKIFIASWGEELNLLSAFGGLTNNSRMRSYGDFTNRIQNPDRVQLKIRIMGTYTQILFLNFNESFPATGKFPDNMRIFQSGIL